MVVRIVKGIWFSSLIATMVVLLYSYASFPEEIQIREGTEFQTISRNGLFYAVLGLLAVFNTLVFVVTRIMGEEDPFFRTWFYGLVVFFNLFILISLQFVSLYNSQEKYNYDSIGYIIYGCVGMIVLWASLWPLHMIVQRFRPKQVIVEEAGE